jgi:hypothetical protein
VETNLRRGAPIQIVNARVKPSQNNEVEVHADSPLTLMFRRCRWFW